MRQSTLITGGSLLAIFGAVYLASAPVPQTPTTAVLFPLSILAILFGVLSAAWGVGQFVLERAVE